MRGRLKRPPCSVTMPCRPPATPGVTSGFSSSFPPLYIRIRALRGKVLYCPDIPFLFAVAYETIQDDDSFKHRLFDYIGEKALS